MNNFDDVEPDGFPIDLADDDFEPGGFVKVGCAVKAIAKLMMSRGANKFQAERDAWPHIYTGVRKGVLHPVSPQTLRVLGVEDFGNGMVLFSELVTWGRTTKLLNFRKAADAVGNGSGAPKVGGGEPAESSQTIGDVTGLLNRNEVIAKFTVKSDPDANEKFWENRLDSPSDQLKIARKSAGKPGTSALWEPLGIAHYLLGGGRVNRHMTPKQLNEVMNKHFPELVDSWKEQTEDVR